MTKDQILQDLEILYQGALAKGRWHTALRAKELQGKIFGLFQQQRLPPIMDIADMTENQLREFVSRLEKNQGHLMKTTTY